MPFAMSRSMCGPGSRRAIGPTGRKTTCFNLVNGQLRPDSGTVTLMGARIDGLPPRDFRMGVGRTFQVAALFASMTVRENVQLALARAGAHRRSAARDRLPGRGSRRVARARADDGIRRAGARRSPTATRSASSLLSHWRQRRNCC